MELGVIYSLIATLWTFVKLVCHVTIIVSIIIAPFLRHHVRRGCWQCQAGIKSSRLIGLELKCAFVAAAPNQGSRGAAPDRRQGSLQAIQIFRLIVKENVSEASLSSYSTISCEINVSILKPRY